MSPPSFRVRAGTVVTTEGAGTIDDGTVVVEGDRITWVGPTSDVPERWSSASVSRYDTGVLIPGLVNAHTHFSEAFLSGAAEGLTLEPWLDAVVRPSGARMTTELAYRGTIAAGAEMLLSGVTTVSDMFVHSASEPCSLGVVEALDELGLRGVVAYAAAGLSTTQTLGEVVAEHRALKAATAELPLIGFRLGVPTLWSQSESDLRALVELAGQEGWGVHAHLGETSDEQSRCRSLGYADAADLARARGLFDVPVLAAHGIWLTDVGKGLLADERHAVIHNPVSNMLLMSGWCDVEDLQRHGVQVALGTDGAGSNDSQNMLEALKVASLVAKDRRGTTSRLEAPAWFDLATSGGGRALGLPGVGTIAVGAPADLVVLSSVGSGPGSGEGDCLRQVVYAASPRNVWSVWVGGRCVVDESRVVSTDVEKLVRGGAPRMKGPYL